MVAIGWKRISRPLCIILSWSRLLGLAGSFWVAQAAQGADTLTTALTPGGFFGYAKLMYVADDKKGGRPNQSTLGIGGKIGAETESFHGFSLRGAWYGTSDLGLASEDPRRTDAYMFDLDKRPYGLLGEAQINFATNGTRLVLGRQELHSPLLDSYDYRIIPNLFEAYTLFNRDLPGTTLTFSYVTKMSGLDGLVTYSRFRSMSQQAYTSLMVTAQGLVDATNGETLDLSTVVGNKGVWMAGLEYEGAYRLALWNAYGVDTLNTLYLEGEARKRLGEGVMGTLGAQAYRVSAVGRFRDYLAQQGLNATYVLYGMKGTLVHMPSGWSLALAYNQFTGGGNTVTAYGNWGGYPEFVGMPYLYAEDDGVSAIAGSRLAKLSVQLDLGAHGLQGQSLLFGHARVDLDASILAGSDIRVNSLLYRARLTSALSARIALEARNSGHSRYDNAFAAFSLRYDF